jgi:uncharacterized protein (DUF433 family)
MEKVTMTTKYTPDEKSAQTIRITVDPEVRGGVPCVGENRWPIALILDALASVVTAEQLTQEQPELTLDDIQLALEAAAWVMRDPSIDWAKLDLAGMVELQRETQAWESLSNDAMNLTDDSSGD